MSYRFNKIMNGNSSLSAFSSSFKELKNHIEHPNLCSFLDVVDVIGSGCEKIIMYSE